MEKKIDAIVTYGWNRVAYNMVRALALRGLKVAVGDSSPMAMSKASRYSTASFGYRSFYKQPQDFIADMESAFHRFKPNVYLPAHEETFVAARYRDRLQKTGVKIPLADFDALRTLHKKDLLAIEVQRLGIPAPKTFRWECLEDLRGVWDEAGRKGRVTIKMVNTNSAKGVFYADSFERMQSVCANVTKDEKLLPKDYPLIQEYVEGIGYGVSMLFNHGVLKAKFTHKRLREKLVTGGTSTLRVSAENVELEGYAEKLLSAMRWHGVAMVEFKYDENAKRGWLIEVNPRFWGSLSLAIHAGVDFPFLSYQMALNGDVDPVMDYKKGVVSRWILGDVLAMLDRIKNKKKFFNIADSSGKAVNFDDFYWDDPLPFFAQCGDYGMKFLKDFKINPTQESILDIDRM